MTDREIQKLYKQTTHAYQVKDFKLAEKLVQQLIAQRPDHWALYLFQGNILTLLKSDRLAVKSYQKVLNYDKDNLEALNNLAIIHRRQGNYELAWKILKKATKLDRTGVDLLYNRGNLARAMGNVNRALKDYKRVLKLDPRYIQAYNNIGIIYEGQEKFDTAAEYYDLGLEQDPQNANLLYNRGVIYQKSEKWDMAEDYFRRALKSRPGWVDCQNNLGIVLQELGKLDQAKKAFHEILNKDRNNPKVLNNMGVVLAQLDDHEEAETYYKEALEQEPEYRNAAMNLNKIYSSQKDYSNSLKEMNRLATLYPFDLEIQNEIGRALIRLNQLNEAEETFNHVLQRDPQNRRALQDLAELKVRLGEEEEGWKLLQKSGIDHREKDEEEALLRMADAFRKNGNNLKAEELLKRHENYAPGDQRVRRRLSRIYEEEQRWDDALEMLDLLGEDQTGDDLTRKVKYNLNRGEKEEALKDMNELMNQQASRGTEEDLNQFREFLELYEDTTSAIMEENRDQWESNINRMSRSLQSLAPVKEQPQEEFPLSSFASRSLSEDDNMTLLDINAMEPIIEINEEREILYLQDEEEDLSDIYTEVMEEERQKRAKEQGLQPGGQAMAGASPQMPPQPIYIPMPQYFPPPQQNQPPPPPQQPPPPVPPVEEEIQQEEPTPSSDMAPQAPREDQVVLSPENPIIIDEEPPVDDVIGFLDEEELLDDEIFIHEDMEENGLSLPEEFNTDFDQEEVPGSGQQESLEEEESSVHEELQGDEISSDQEELQLEEEVTNQQELHDEGKASPVQELSQEEILPEEVDIEVLDQEEILPEDLEEEIHPHKVTEPDLPHPPEPLPHLQEMVTKPPEAVPPPMEEPPWEEEELSPHQEAEPEEPEMITLEAEKKPEPSLDRESLANMFKYLSEFTETLPEKEKRDMIQHEVPLKMEVVRSKLEGERSLLNTAQHFDRRSMNREATVELDDEKITKSLSFLKELSHQYPTELVSQNIDSKMAKLLGKMEKIKKLKE